MAKENLYNEVDSSLAAINAIPGTITENSVHNNESLHLNENRDIDSSLKIDKSEKVSLDLLESKKETYKSVAAFDVAHFQNKRPISKTLSDLNDQRLLDDIKNETTRSTEVDVILAEAINLEDEEREKADAQLKIDIAKEALARANSDSELAGIIEKYKLAMSQHITTRELDVNGDARINLEVQDADYHGGNLEVQTSLVVGNEDSNGLATEEGKIIGDAHIKHDLTVDNDARVKHDLTVDNDFTVNGDTTFNGNLMVKKNLTVDIDANIKRDLTVENDATINNDATIKKNLTVNNDITVDNNATIKKNLTVNSDVNIKNDLIVDNDTTIGHDTTIGNDLLVENDSHITNDLLVGQNTTIEGNLDVNGTATLNELEVENNLSVDGNLKVKGDTDLDKTLNVDGAVTLNDTLTVEKDTTLKDDLVVNKTVTIDGATQLNNTLTVEKATQLNDTLGVKKATTLEDTLNVKKGSLLEDTLQVNKRTDIGTDQTNADLYVHGSEHISNNLNVTETSNLGTTNIGTAEANKNLTVNGNETISGTLSVTGKSTLGTVAAGTTTIGTISANKNLTVNGNETITGNLTVNKNTDLDGTLNVDGETTLSANVKIKDDSNTQKSFSDIIGTIKNALVKDFTQSYNSTTGQLTSTLTFNNLYSGNTNRPTVNTITKTINLDLEKYILDINDVYATKTISNGKTTYTDFDISTLTDEEIRDLDSPDYTGNIVRCLKVKYNTYNNTNAGTEKSYVYFEINDIFKSIISKLELEINNEITDRNNAITNAINNLDVASVGSNGGYIKTISETNGKISATRQPFDTSISSSSTANNAPTSKAVYDFIETLDVAAVGQDGSYLKTISETNGKISTTTQSFDTAINANSTDNNVPTSKAVKTYVSQEINSLDVGSVGSDGGYIKTISESNGKISANRQSFDTVINSTSTANNAPTSKAVYDFIGTLDVASVGSDGGYIKTISETNGKISAARQPFDTSISSTSTNAPTSKAVYDFIGTLDFAAVGENGKYIKTVSETNGKVSATTQSFDTTISDTSTHNNAPTSKAVSNYIYSYLKSHEKQITLKDAAGNTLLSFICYAPTTTDYSPALGNITLNTTTII